MARHKELISQREYARRRGISNVAVHRAVASGRISTVDGRIDPVQADREWRENTDQSKPRNRITGQPQHRRVPSAPSEPMVLGDDGPSGGGILQIVHFAQKAHIVDLQFRHFGGQETVVFWLQRVVPCHHKRKMWQLVRDFERSKARGPHLLFNLERRPVP